MVEQYFVLIIIFFGELDFFGRRNSDFNCRCTQETFLTFIRILMMDSIKMLITEELMKPH